MKNIYKNYLFNQHYLVNDANKEDEHWFEVMFSLAHFFNIHIDEKTSHLATPDMIKYCQNMLGNNVPAPFYKGFPQSVRELTPDQLLFDQLLDYTISYGMGDFDAPEYSVFEKDFKRTAFNEKTQVKEFAILTEAEAEDKLTEIVNNLLKSTRPLNDIQYDLFVEFTNDYDYIPVEFASKNTLVKYLISTRNLNYVKFMNMSDVIKLVDEMNWQLYQNKNIKKLHFSMKDRGFITEVIDKLFDLDKCDLEVCHEKKKIWCGLLHHIHYQTRKNKIKETFCYSMRNKGNLSVYSQTERYIKKNQIADAVGLLKDKKGITAVLRNLEYYLSRCNNLNDIQAVLDSIKGSQNIIVLLQLLLKYNFYKDNKEPRVFTFTKYNMQKVHRETPDECVRRKTHLNELTTSMISIKIRQEIENALKGKLGKVYIDPEMNRYALPIQNNTSQGGFGVLATGSRLPIPEGKKLRAFTYWENVNDIDISCFGIDEDGNRTEFSWRNMASRQSDAITFSGDCTRGYYGGSEYFDIDLDVVKKLYPKMRYMIFANNVYSGINFSKCYCTAGYMIRDILDSGEIYEPKTVESSYRIDCESTYAYLFGIDLTTREMVWLNVAREGNTRVAGTTEFDFLIKHFYATKCINMQSYFETMASEIVDDPLEADVVVTNKVIEGIKEDTEVIREYDFDKMLKYLN